LDTGADENLLLTSRDNQSSIIVTYKELKSCITSAFNDIYTKTAQHTSTTTAITTKRK
jgi:PAB-dependent poly(A)-specific ribonuclease subunit 3